MRLYAIGDIHGQLGMLEDVHERIERDRLETGDTTAPVVHLGDLVDRGPDSRGVLDFLVAGAVSGQPWITIRGNHDAMFSEFLSEAEDPDDHLHPSLTWASGRLGGLATLASYGVRSGILRARRAIWLEARDKVPESHVRFLANLPLLYAAPGLVFVHAGIRPGVPITEQTDQDLLWIREPFLSDSRDHGALIVHGHTPVDYPGHFGNRVDLDTGAGFGNKLTVAVFEGTDCWVLTESGRLALKPYY